jgi:hypothetical protein
LDTARAELEGVDVADAFANQYGGERPSAARFVVSQTVMVRSQDVDRVVAASARVGELVQGGVVLSSAEQFANDSRSRLGGIRQANQGVFVILPRDQVAGIPEETQPLKTVRVVTTVEYYLKD